MGKTLLTALLLRQLRESGVNALGMKPFCSGGIGDVELIEAVQGSELPRDWINPFCYADPVAPLVAMRKSGQALRMGEVLATIRRVAARCDCLLIEGSGGLLVPLGENFTVADLVARLRCETIVVSRNRLGTINHTLLSVEALRARGVRRLKVALMEQRVRDESAASNAEILAELLASTRVVAVPYLGARAARIEAVKAGAKKIQKTLACLTDFDSFTTRSSEPRAVTKRLKAKKFVDSRCAEK